jgi:hypothetical protein
LLRYALQLHPVRDIPSDSVPALLVCLRPLYQQIEAPTEVAECFRGGSELRFLRLVGLAIFAIEVANRIKKAVGGNHSELFD